MSSAKKRMASPVRAKSQRASRDEKEPRKRSAMDRIALAARFPIAGTGTTVQRSAWFAAVDAYGCTDLVGRGTLDE